MSAASEGIATGMKGPFSSTGNAPGYLGNNGYQRTCAGGVWPSDREVEDNEHYLR